MHYHYYRAHITELILLWALALPPLRPLHLFPFPPFLPPSPPSPPLPHSTLLTFVWEQCSAKGSGFTWWEWFYTPFGACVAGGTSWGFRASTGASLGCPCPPLRQPRCPPFACSCLHSALPPLWDLCSSCSLLYSHVADYSTLYICCKPRIPC
jgi:hypothetical protein